MRRIVEANGARLLLLLVPANVQACASADLDVYPRNVDLRDGELFDLEQRVLAQMAAAPGIAAVDLRPVLAQAGHCLYQPRNMPWLPEAHERVANFVADLLAREQANSSAAAAGRAEGARAGSPH